MHVEHKNYCGELNVGDIVDIYEKPCSRVNFLGHAVVEHIAHGPVFGYRARERYDCLVRFVDGGDAVPVKLYFPLALSGASKV